MLQVHITEQQLHPKLETVILILQEVMRLDDDDDDKSRQMMQNHNDIITKFGVPSQIMTHLHNTWPMLHEGHEPVVVFKSFCWQLTATSSKSYQTKNWKMSAWVHH
jgi:hypothetical protein